MKFTTCLKLLVLIIGLASCTGAKKRKLSELIDDSLNVAIKKAAILKTKDSLAQDVRDSILRSKYLYLKDDSICVATDSKIYRIPKDTTIDYKHAIAGICEINGDSIKRRYNLVWNGRLYFTTYNEVGMGPRGQLYVYDLVRNMFINDIEFKTNYLYSGTATFIIDRKTNKIFSVDKPRWNERKDLWAAVTAMCSIKGNHLESNKFFYEVRDDWYDDTSLIRFYNHSLVNNGKLGKVLPLH